ncbi:MAG: glycosyltransferase family 4 protein [Bacteroidota bacterium]
MSKILIVGPAYPLRGGLATYNERLAREFQAMGHTCHILSFSLQYPSLLFPGKTQYSTDTAPDDLFIMSEINSINPINWIKVGNRIKKDKYDLVVFRYWMSFMAPAFGTLARRIKSNGHTKIIAITDNLFPHEKRFFDSAFTRFFIPQCDAYLTMSHSVQKQLSQYVPGKKITYTPHPMYDMFGPKMDSADARKKLNLDVNGRYLLFFGFIRKYKGLGLLLDAIADERIRQLNMKLIVAGEFYEDAQPYLDQIKAHGLENQILLHTDFIPNNEVAAYFSASDAVIQPYLHATQSGVTQIAYYYNKPMIVTNVGGLAELVPDGEAGYVCDVNATRIADAIVKFYTVADWKAFEVSLEREKQKFTWATVCKELLKLAE